MLIFRTYFFWVITAVFSVWPMKWTIWVATWTLLAGYETRLEPFRMDGCPKHPKTVRSGSNHPFNSDVKVQSGWVSVSVLGQQPLRRRHNFQCQVSYNCDVRGILAGYRLFGPCSFTDWRILAGSLWSTAPTEARTVLISGFLLCKKHMSDRLRQNLWKTKVVGSGLGMFKCGQSIHELDMAKAHFKCTGQGLDD